MICGSLNLYVKVHNIPAKKQTYTFYRSHANSTRNIKSLCDRYLAKLVLFARMWLYYSLLFQNGAFKHVLWILPQKSCTSPILSCLRILCTISASVHCISQRGCMLAAVGWCELIYVYQVYSVSPNIYEWESLTCNLTAHDSNTITFFCLNMLCAHCSTNMWCTFLVTSITF